MVNTTITKEDMTQVINSLIDLNHELFVQSAQLDQEWNQMMVNFEHDPLNFNNIMVLISAIMNAQQTHMKYTRDAILATLNAIVKDDDEKTPED